MRSLSTCSDRASGSGALGRLRLTALGLLAFLLFAGLPTSAWTAVGAYLSALADSHALARITTCSPCSVADGAKPGATYTYDGKLHSSPRMHALPHVTAPAGDIASRSMHGVIAERAAATATGVAANTEEALVGAGRSVGPGAAHVSDPSFGGDLSRVIDETAAGKGDITSSYLLNSDEALQLGEQFLGPGYRELGDAGSGVFRSADDLRQFRMDPGSLSGSHAPGVPHVHLEIFDPGARFPWVNNHIPFYDEVWP